ncbi:MAG TPA: 3-hydroxyacyl-ACP dehydratase FabZ [Nitrospiria bacterium]|nr:3-hydroxyacyl-ACP dehydratase FabZ [Nitrospiria bacterium]
MIDARDILGILPHRYPFLLIDRIEEIEIGRRIVGIKNVTIGEPYFQGHFPDRPIMPGVLIIEAMAQVGGVLAFKSSTDPKKKLVYFLAIEKAKFRKPVLPGDQIRFELTVAQSRPPYWKLKGTAHVEKTLVCEAQLTAMLAEDAEEGGAR